LEIFEESVMAFEILEPVPADAILGLMTAFQADPAPDKVDLTVGVYRNAEGLTPVIGAVAAAEQRLTAQQKTKAYLPPIGDAGFCRGMRRLVLGNQAESLEARTAVIQAPGGCGALRLGAELFTRAQPGQAVYLSVPTWGNHHGLMSGAGLPIKTYPYYDPVRHSFELDRMLEALSQIPARSLVMLQASCHNPTGADPDMAAWSQILDVVEQRELVPFFDLAYLGLGDGFQADAAPIQAATSRLPEVLVALSCSKNFGLYRERTGALLVLGSDAAQRAIIESHLKNIARGMYSMAPAHGALIVDRILADPVLTEQWRDEVAEMSQRLVQLRHEFAGALAALRPDLDLSWLAQQRGMFSLLGIEAEQVRALREDQHIYMVGDSRVNIAGLNDRNIPVVAEAVAPLLR
jgi:aspartate/tyrosine/aromatic aminotransferase